MQTPANRALVVFSAALVVWLFALAVLYPGGLRQPGFDHAMLRISFAVVLVVLVVAALTRSTVWALVSVVAGLGFVVGVGLYTASLTLHPDSLIDLLTIALMTVGVGLYAAALARSAYSAVLEEKQREVVLDMSVDLVPKALDAGALARLMHAVRVATSSDGIVILSQDGTALSDGRLDAGDDVLGARERSLAMMMFARQPDRGEGGEDSSGPPQPILTTRGFALIPVTTSAGSVERVLVAGRAQGRGQGWDAREASFLRFTANLLGALIERELLQQQATKVGIIEEADRLKANLLLSVSHDLKTPIAAASASLTSVIDELAAAPEHAGSARELASVNEDLAAVDARVTELIDIARLETASWKTNLDYNDVGDLCNLVRSAVAERWRDRVQCANAIGFPPFRFDLVQMGRALHHVVQNALTYSPPESPVAIQVDYDEASVSISVIDQGPGLTAEDKELMFDKFYRGSASRSAPHGSGLGLSIAEKIVAGHGGHIEVADAEGGGTCVVVVLPRMSEEFE